MSSFRHKPRHHSLDSALCSPSRSCKWWLLSQPNISNCIFCKARPLLIGLKFIFVTNRMTFYISQLTFWSLASVLLMLESSYKIGSNVWTSLPFIWVREMWGLLERISEVGVTAGGGGLIAGLDGGWVVGGWMVGGCGCTSSRGGTTDTMAGWGEGTLKGWGSCTFSAALPSVVRVWKVKG